MSQKLFILLPIGILLLIIVGLTSLIKSRFKNKQWLTILSSAKGTYFLLLSWSILGFLLRLDFTENFGCIVYHEPIFAFNNVIFSAIAAGLFSLGFYVKSKRLGVALLFIELLIWLYKLFLIKGGYAVGYGGIPSSAVVTFDFIAITLRISLLKQLIAPKLKFYWVFLLAFVVMATRLT
jgi:hypothetical protein